MLRLIFLFLLLIHSAVWAQDSPSESHQTSTLSVVGRGEVLVDPDEAVVQVGVREEAISAKEAQLAVNKAVEKILAALANLEISPQQIRTSQLNLQAVYSDARNRRENGEPQIIAYRASYNLSVRTSDLSKVSSVIDTALESGANQLSGIHFELKDDRGAQKEALRRAVSDAEEKARVIAEAAGAQLHQIMEIIENGATIRPPVMGRTAMMAAEMSGPPTAVMPGQMTVIGQVTIRYQFTE